MLAWPSSSCTVRRSAPPESRCVAKLCRNVCGLTLALTPARRTYFFTSTQSISRDSGLPQRGRAEQFHRAVGDAFLQAEKAIEHLDGHEVARDTARGQPFLAQVGEVVAEVAHARREVIVEPAGGEPLREAIEVAPVGEQG